MPSERIKIVITGATGLLGRALVEALGPSEKWEVQQWGLSRAKDYKDCKEVDLRKREEVEKKLEEFRPDVVVHTAGERRPDVLENKPDLTEELNEKPTTYLAEYCAQKNIKLLYLSTDYVFDGKSPEPYEENAETSPLSTYGISKVRCEQITLKACETFAILRVPLLFGEVEDPYESAVTTLWPAVKDASKETKVDDVAVRYPTYTKNVAKIVDFLLGKMVDGADGCAGVFHYTDLQPLTKYEMALIMGERLHVPTDHIVASKAPPAPNRPKNTVLACKKLKDLGAEFNSDFRSEIAHVINKLEQSAS